MLSTLRQQVASVLPLNSRASRRQERSSLREGTTPPLRRSLRTLRVFVGTSVLCRPRSSCRLLRRLRRPQLPLRSSTGGLGGVRGRKVPPRRPSVLLDRHHPHSVSVQCEHPAASRTSGAGSFSLRKPAVGTSPLARLLRSSVRLRLVITWTLFIHTSVGVNPVRSVPGVQKCVEGRFY